MRGTMGSLAVSKKSTLMPPVDAALRAAMSGVERKLRKSARQKLLAETRRAEPLAHPVRFFDQLFDVVGPFLQRRLLPLPGGPLEAGHDPLEKRRVLHMPARGQLSTNVASSSIVVCNWPRALTQRKVQRNQSPVGGRKALLTVDQQADAIDSA
jgi:hypothetical protein